MCLAITSMRKLWLVKQPGRCPAQISLQENVLPYFLQLPQLEVEHNLVQDLAVPRLLSDND